MCGNTFLLTLQMGIASSAPVERVFSASGWLVSKRRCSMKDDTVSLLTFLSVNKQYFPVQE